MYPLWVQLLVIVPILAVIAALIFGMIYYRFFDKQKPKPDYNHIYALEHHLGMTPCSNKSCKYCYTGIFSEAKRIEVAQRRKDGYAAENETDILKGRQMSPSQRSKPRYWQYNPMMRSMELIVDGRLFYSVSEGVFKDVGQHEIEAAIDARETYDTNKMIQASINKQFYMAMVPNAVFGKEGLDVREAEYDYPSPPKPTAQPARIKK